MQTEGKEPAPAGPREQVLAEAEAKRARKAQALNRAAAAGGIERIGPYIVSRWVAARNKSLR